MSVGRSKHAKYNLHCGHVGAQAVVVLYSTVSISWLADLFIDLFFAAFTSWIQFLWPAVICHMWIWFFVVLTMSHSYWYIADIKVKSEVWSRASTLEYMEYMERRISPSAVLGSAFSIYTSTGPAEFVLCTNFTLDYSCYHHGLHIHYDVNSHRWTVSNHSSCCSFYLPWHAMRYDITCEWKLQPHLLSTAYISISSPVITARADAGHFWYTLMDKYYRN